MFSQEAYCISRSVGTFARALDCTSTVRQPSLHMSAAAASRDITLVSIKSGPEDIKEYSCSTQLSAIFPAHKC